jgi:zinc protease
MQGGSSMGKLVRGYRSFSAYALLGKGGVQPAIDALVQEDERRAAASARMSWTAPRTCCATTSAYSERDKSDSSGFAAEYSRNFLEQEAIPGIANELLYAQELLPQVTLAGNQRDGGQGHPRPAKKAGVFMGAEPKAGDAASERRRSSNCSMPWRKPSSKPSSRARKKVLASKLMPDSLPAGGAASSKSSTAPSA